MIKSYYADITDLSFNDSDLDIFSIERKSYILSIKDYRRRLQSYFVWKLLLKILPQDNLNFTVLPTGEWVEKDNKIFISLSHSNNLVCVTISNSACGIDVEMRSDKILKLKNKYKITNSNDLILDLTKKFTFEEAYFKSKNAPKSTSINVSDKLNNSYVITCCGAENSEFYKMEI